MSYGNMRDKVCVRKGGWGAQNDRWFLSVNIALFFCNANYFRNFTAFDIAYFRLSLPCLQAVPLLF